MSLYDDTEMTDAYVQYGDVDTEMTDAYDDADVSVVATTPYLETYSYGERDTEMADVYDFDDLPTKDKRTAIESPITSIILESPSIYESPPIILERSIEKPRDKGKGAIIESPEIELPILKSQIIGPSVVEFPTKLIDRHTLNYGTLMKVIDNGAAMLSFISGEDYKKSLCDLIDSSDIMILKTLGAGIQGTVYQVSIEGENYAMKSTNYIRCIEIKGDRRVSRRTYLESLAPFFEQICEEYSELCTNYSFSYILDLNDDYLQGKTNKIFIPFYYEDCPRKEMVLRASKSYTLTDDKVITGYFCYNEFLLQFLCSKLYMDGLCANFLKCYNLSLCDDNFKMQNYGNMGRYIKHSLRQMDYGVKVDLKSYKEYMLIEEADGTLNRLLRDLRINIYQNNETLYGDITKEEFCFSLAVQILFSLSIMISKYKMIHKDLHFENIFYSRIKPGDTFAGEDINSKYFYYEIGDEEVYFRNVGYIFKIADFGYGAAYDVNNHDPEVVIGAGNILNGKYPHAPPDFLPIYDIFRVIVIAQDYNINIFKEAAIDQYNLQPIYNDMLSSRDEYSDSSLLTKEKYGMIKRYKDRLLPQNVLLSDYFMEHRLNHAVGNPVRLGSL